MKLSTQIGLIAGATVAGALVGASQGEAVVKASQGCAGAATGLAVMNVLESKGKKR